MPIKSAFYGCSNLASITIPQSVTSIGDYAFYGCDGLTKIYVDENNQHYSSYDGVLYNKLKTELLYVPKKISGMVTIPTGITAIGSDAFRGCSNLLGITIPNSITSVGDDAFADCNGLTGVYISDIAAWCNIKFEVGHYGDYYSNPLSYAGALYLNEALVTDFVIPEGITNIYGGAFCGCTSLINITIPKSVISIGGGAFRYCSGLKGVYIDDIAAWCQIDFKWCEIWPDRDDYSANPLLQAHNLYIDGELASELIVPSDVTTIKKYAFWGCESLISVDLQNGITAIGTRAFCDCTNLKSISIAETLEKIGDLAFSGCNNLKDVYITNLTAWCSVDFYPYWSGSMHFRATNPLSHGGNLYLNGSLVTDLIIPSDLTVIAAGAFYGCDSITSVTIPDNIITIGDGAFRGCENLISVSMADSVTSIKGMVFADCNKLQNINLSRELTSIGAYAFWYCKSLTSIVIPISVTSIGKREFQGCSTLKDIYCEVNSKPSGWYNPAYDTLDWTGGCRAIVHWGNTWEYVDGVPTLK